MKSLVPEALTCRCRIAVQERTALQVIPVSFNQRVRDTTDTLQCTRHAEGMSAFLLGKRVWVLKYARFAEPLRDVTRQDPQERASSAGRPDQPHIREEDTVVKALEQRGSPLGWRT